MLDNIIVIDLTKENVFRASISNIKIENEHLKLLALAT